MQSEATAPLSTSAGTSSVWYLNINPTPTDITDKSGKGHNPSWVGSERPALFTDGSANPPPAPPTNLRILFLIGAAVYRARLRPSAGGDDDDSLI
jgi:hypothetical protein